MYADQLPDKTYEQGEAMADAILESIAGFDHDYEHAKAAEMAVRKYGMRLCGGHWLRKRRTVAV